MCIHAFRGSIVVRACFPTILSAIQSCSFMLRLLCLVDSKYFDVARESNGSETATHNLIVLLPGCDEVRVFLSLHGDGLGLFAFLSFARPHDDNVGK